MRTGEIILSAFGPDEIVTTTQLRDRTGLTAMRIATYMSRMRAMGQVERVGTTFRPMSHRLAGAAKLRAQMIAGVPSDGQYETSESMVGRAIRTQPVSVFQLGRFS